jgi:flavin-dependent dehydrogenase
VLLLERGKFPRHKVCGEFVSAESLGLLASLLDAEHAHLLNDTIRIAAARIFADGRVLETPVDPSAASITRFDLDAALWRSAQNSGVETKEQVVVHSISGNGSFQVATSVGNFETRAVINASGRWSNLSAAATAEEKQSPKWIGLKAHFAESRPAQSVDLYFFEGGYCGVQLLGSESINACAMVRADVANQLSNVFALNSVLAERSSQWQPLTDPISVSPLIFREPQPVRDGVFMAGDAAAFVDPFVGDGISLAVRSGTLAAGQVISFLKGKTRLENSLIEYRQRYRENFAHVFQTSSKIRRMLVLPRAVRKPLLFILQNAPGITRYLMSNTR